jgi:drug/metabolite transporter (DMT)-like permease
MSITRVTRDKPSNALGLGFALFSAATFATSGTFADSLMTTGWTPGAVVTARITLAALFLTVPAIVALRGKWATLRAALPSVAAFGVTAVAGCQLFFFTAVQHLDVGVALLLEYLGILLVVVWMWVRHAQTPRRLTVLGGVVALLGLVFVLSPGTGGIDLVGVLWGLLAACGLAVYFVLSSKSHDVLPPIALAWAAMVVGASTLIVLDLVHAVPFRVRSVDVVLLDRRMSWVVPVIGLSLVAAAIAYVAGIAAARLLGARLASFVGLTEVLFAVLIAWALLGQAPGLGQMVGGVAVLIGIALVRADDATAGADSLPVPEPAARVG